MWRLVVAVFGCAIFFGCGGEGGSENAGEGGTGNAGEGGSENAGEGGTGNAGEGGSENAGEGGTGNAGASGQGTGGTAGAGGDGQGGSGGTSSGGSSGSGGNAGTGGGGNTGSDRIYLFWVASPADAAIKILDAATGLVLDTKHVITGVPNTTAIDFAALPDGTFRLLWVDNVAETLWVLDADFQKIDEVAYTRDTNSNLLCYVKRPDGSGRLGHWVHAMNQSSVWFAPLLADDTRDDMARVDIIGHELPWTPKQYFPLHDGSSRVLWWNAGKFELVELDADDALTGNEIAPEATFELVAESYSQDAAGTVLMGWQASNGQAALCTYASDSELDVFPSEEGWGPGKCSYYEGQMAWSFKGHVVVP